MSPPDTSLSAFHDVAQAAIAALPAPFAQAARQVALHIVDLPPDTMLRHMQIDDPLELTGLYEGIPLTERSVMDQPLGQDTIWLFREPILAEWHDRGDVALPDLITHVLVHELAHHFGWSDADIAQIDRWWE